MSESGDTKLGRPEQPQASSLKDRIVSTKVAVKAGIGDDLPKALSIGINKYPQLAELAITRLNDALNPDEQRLIAETALTTYYITRSLFQPSLVDMDESVVLERPGDQAITAAVADNIAERKKDKNSIYQSLKEDMIGYEDLAEYIVGQMRSSVSLEEANMLGDTALIIFNVVKNFTPQS